MRRFAFLAPVLLLCMSACASKTPPLATNSSLTVIDAASLPAPDGETGGSGARAYTIGPLDTLVVTVHGVEDLGGEMQVDTSGRISVPLVGVVAAGGKTPGEVSEIIEQGLRGRYLRNPQVTVNVKETLSQLFTVDGQVEQPGRYPVQGDVTLMQAVATAKGATEFAKLSDVVVFRTVSGQRMAALYNLAAIRRGIYPDPKIYANDVVVVGDSSARRMFRDVLGAAPLLLGPVIALLQSR